MIVFLPSIGWRVNLIQRPHHLAREFARAGYLTIFDSSNQSSSSEGISEVEPNLFLFHGGPNLLGEIPQPIVWAFPHNYHLVKQYPNAAATIYDWIDDLSVFPYDRELLERNHARALKEATMVTCVSRVLDQEAKRVRSDAIYLPNAVEYERFARQDVEAPDDEEWSALVGRGKPIAGYYGALASWFDYDLIDKVAALRPDWNFALIGDALDGSVNDQPVLSRDNVFWMGPRKYETLPRYLRNFDVALIPFAINSITIATSPLKLYEYLAAGKPVIATPMPECESVSEVRIVSDAEELSRALDLARQDSLDPEFRNRLRALAQDHSWASRVETVIDALPMRLTTTGEPSSESLGKRILIGGYFGFGNSGDEAILTAMLRDLRSLCAELSFTVVSGNPRETATRYQVHSILWTDLPKIIGAAQQSDLIILGGGGLFQDYWGAEPDTLLTRDHSNNSYYAGFPLLAALTDKPCMLYSVGVGPLYSEEGRRLTRIAFEAASAATVRDSESLALVKELGIASDRIRVTADPAFSLVTDRLRVNEALSDARLEPNSPLIGVCLRAWDFDVAPDNWQSQIAKALDLFAESRNASLIFIPFQESSGELTDDRSVAEKVIGLMRMASKARILSGRYLPAEICGILGECDLVIGMRLHSLIFALKEGVPSVAIAYDPKVNNLMRRAGMAEYDIELKTLTTKRVLETLNRAWSNRKAVRDEIATKAGELKQLASDNARVALELLGDQGNQRERPGTVMSHIKQLALKQTRRLDTLAERQRLIVTGREEQRELDLQMMTAQLEMVTEELNSLKSSLGWRLLSKFGPIKYRYLLPIYRALRLMRPGRNVSDKDRPEELVREANEAAVSTNNFDVVCFPIIEWGFRYQRPQQLMSRFAAAGSRVFYISQKFRSSGSEYLIEKKASNIYEVSLRGPALNTYKDELNDHARDELFSSLDRLRRDLSLGATASIVQLPFWWPLANEARRRFSWPVIYDCMDHHAGFSTNSRKMLEHEGQLMTSADLVIASSTFLECEARRRNPGVLRVPNGCDYEHFAASEARRGAKPVIGYYGAIAEWFDSDLLGELAQRRPDWEFVLVGSTYGADTRRLSEIDNVRLLGEVPYSNLPYWLSSIDATIIPFKRTPLTEATDPVKVYEILAAGKPLVSVPLPEISRFFPLVRVASTAAEFDREITQALEEDGPELVAQRRKFARDNTWQKRFETLAPAVRDTFAKASIIVVTYNNLKINRMCIESIYGQTEWPNFEVVVVDNASTDGTREYLREAEKILPNLQVVLNNENLGFAAANNIGLRRSTGEYLVLLNNDTLVTRRWLTALIRHLHSDPRIGIIGPVTNNIANEARIEVWYRTLDELPAFAAEQARSHDGEITDINMLAMFCLALRREVYEKVGPLDEQFGIGLFEDDDYSQRVKLKGLRIVCAADSFVHHFGQASFKKLSSVEYKRLFEENRSRYEEKWAVKWIPHKRQAKPKRSDTARSRRALTGRLRPQRGVHKAKNNHFKGMSSLSGRCNICGSETQFFYSDKALYRESLVCGECLTTSRYRSVARGILRAIRELTGIEATSLTALAEHSPDNRIAVYDTQAPFYFDKCAYPIPDLLDRCRWIDITASVFKPDKRPGTRLARNVINQNLESLSFPDASFDILITSDVMEHVRLDDSAHQEIRRVLKPGGFYIFTVPHFRDRYETFYRVLVTDPSDPTKDRYITEKEYHGDANSKEGAALSYRSYGRCLDDTLQALGFRVDYSKEDLPELGIMNTELFLCRAP